MSVTHLSAPLGVPGKVNGSSLRAEGSPITDQKAAQEPQADLAPCDIFHCTHRYQGVHQGVLYHSFPEASVGLDNSVLALPAPAATLVP